MGDEEQELIRQFQAQLAGASPEVMLRAISEMGRLIEDQPSTPLPSLRRQPLEQPVILQVRADLKRAAPPIWRRLQIRSDLTLDTVHQILQAAFDWTDSHLHRFAIGGDPFDRKSEHFLCPFEVEEGDVEGIPATDVRLDETLQEPGDALEYVYDFGDYWEVVIRLEAAFPLDPNGPPAKCIDGRRAAPPEDCGGRTTSKELAAIVDDPAFFDVDEANDALSAPHIVLRASGLDPRAIDLIRRLEFSEPALGVFRRAQRLQPPVTDLSTSEKAVALNAYSFFLDRVGSEGLQLTSAGYLKPADAEAISAVLPTLHGWIGKKNRETQTIPLLNFRESMRELGLVRKFKGKLVLTPAGRSMLGNPEKLWIHIVSRLVSDKSHYETEASLLLLICLATTSDQAIDFGEIASALHSLGWRQDGGQPDKYAPYHLLASNVAANVNAESRVRISDFVTSPAATALALDALFGSSR